MAISNVLDIADVNNDSLLASSLGSRSFFNLGDSAVDGGSAVTAELASIPTYSAGPDFQHTYIRNPGIRGKQVITGPEGIATINLVDGVFSADTDGRNKGRNKIASNFFDSATVTSKFEVQSIPLDKLVESLLVVSGSQTATGNISLGGFRLLNLGTPTLDADTATKAYADSLTRGFDVKNSVRVATTTPLAANTRTGNVLTADVNGALSSVDGITLALNDRILVKDEVLQANNGIYFVSAVGDVSNPWTLTRTIDADEDIDVTAGMFTFVEEGTINKDQSFVLITDTPVVVNTTSLNFVQYTGAGQITAGDGLVKTGNSIDIEASNTSIVVGTNDLSVGYGLDAAVTSIEAGNAVNAGASDLAARSDHQHGVSTAPPGSIQADDVASEGVASTLARSDHVHEIVTDAPVAVDNNNSLGGSLTFARSDHIHLYPHWTTLNKDDVPLATSGNEATTGITIAATPAMNGYIIVIVNRLSYVVGDGSKLKDCFFSADGGTTARALNAIQSGDTLFWNGIITGFDLLISDRVSMFYEAF